MRKFLGLLAGESTTMALIAERWGMIPELRTFAKGGRPIWGTCAGLIFLADKASGLSHKAFELVTIATLEMYCLAQTAAVLGQTCRDAFTLQDG